jgi:preprotein translocase subunit SecF
VLAVLLIGAQFLGATTLQSYGLALFVGLLSGAYSSIFIAAPVLSMMKEREERWVSIASRLAKRGETDQWYSALDAATMSTQMSVAASGQVGRGGGAGAAAQRSGGSKRSGPIRPGSGSRPGGGSGTGGGGGTGTGTAVIDRPPDGSASAAGTQTPARTQTQTQGQATQRPRKGKSKRKRRR